MLFSLTTICFWIALPSAESIEWREPPLMKWEMTVLDAFESNDYDDVIQLINDARGARLAIYPDSTWYSATGD